MTPSTPITREPPSRPDVWCAIPVYNNNATIRDVAERARQQMAHVVVVDDGSTRADLGQLLAGLDVVLLTHERNRGKGAAILTALRYAAEHHAEHLIILDGDGQHFPEDVPHFVQQLAPHTILIGYRQEVLGAMPHSSRFGRDFSDFWIYLETGAFASDTQSGFRSYPVPDVLALCLNSRHYNFEVDVITRAIWSGLAVRTIPIRVWYPDPTHRISSFRPFLDNLRISLTHARLVGRQLSPLPHRRAVPAARKVNLTKRLQNLVIGNTTPLGFAAAACAAASLGSLPTFWCRALAIAYVSMRLHLNKPVAMLILGLCAWPVLPNLCIALGRQLVHGDNGAVTSGLAEWFVGSLVVAPVSGMLAAGFAYAIARQIRPISDATTTQTKLPSVMPTEPTKARADEHC